MLQPEIIEWARLTAKDLGATHYSPFDWSHQGPIFYNITEGDGSTVVGWKLEETKGPYGLPSPMSRMWAHIVKLVSEPLPKPKLNVGLLLIERPCYAESRQKALELILQDGATHLAIANKDYDLYAYRVQDGVWQVLMLDGFNEWPKDVHLSGWMQLEWDEYDPPYEESLRGHFDPLTVEFMRTHNLKLFNEQQDAWQHKGA